MQLRMILAVSVLVLGLVASPVRGNPLFSIGDRLPVSPQEEKNAPATEITAAGILKFLETIMPSFGEDKQSLLAISKFIKDLGEGRIELAGGETDLPAVTADIPSIPENVRLSYIYLNLTLTINVRGKGFGLYMPSGKLEIKFDREGITSPVPPPSPGGIPLIPGQPQINPRGQRPIKGTGELLAIADLIVGEGFRGRANYTPPASFER